MEFYATNAIKTPKNEVSIPNGMEFYILFPYPNKIVVCVSIPNGMKFYAGAFLSERG